MLTQIVLVAAVLLLSGCASTTGTFFNRPVVEDDVGDVIHTVSLSADRRTVIVERDPKKPVRYCAEPPPDTATALKTNMSATVKSSNEEVSIKDQFGTTVTVLAARNAPLDAYRTGLYALCQFWMNRAISNDNVIPMFEKLLATFENTQKAIPALTAPAATPDPAKK